MLGLGAHTVSNPTGLEDRANLAAVEHLFAAMAVAESGGNREAWKQLWHPQAWELAPEAPFAFGREAVCFGLAGWFRDWVHDARIRCEEIQIVQERWAFASGTVTRRSNQKDGNGSRYFDGKFLAVLNRGADRQWKLYRYCFNNSVPRVGR